MGTSVLAASVSVFSSVFTLSALEAASRSCLMRSSLLACASCSRFYQSPIITRYTGIFSTVSTYSNPSKQSCPSSILLAIWL